MEKLGDGGERCCRAICCEGGERAISGIMMHTLLVLQFSMHRVNAHVYQLVACILLVACTYVGSDAHLLHLPTVNPSTWRLRGRRRHGHPRLTTSVENCALDG